MIRNFIENSQLEYYEKASLKKYNTYRLDVKCDYLVMPHDEEELRKLICELRKCNYKYVVLGNGSNVIFQDDYYKGCVILLNKLNELKKNGSIIEVGAGYPLPKLALETAEMGLTGLEFASGIPGLVGASVSMNAGAYKSSMSEVVESVRVLNKEMDFVTITKAELDFSYRNSILKENSEYVVVSVVMKLEDGDKSKSLELISKRRVKRIETQPLDMPSAGSVFRNPDGMYAGELIENCGLKGYKIGGAMISEKHANFIVNIGDARGEDIVKLINFVKNEVKKVYDVDLILEQIIIK